MSDEPTSQPDTQPSQGGVGVVMDGATTAIAYPSNFLYNTTQANFVLSDHSTPWSTVVSVPTQNYGIGNDLSGTRVASLRGKISASLYFRYVKRNFSTSQRRALDARLGKLTGIHLQCKETGQQALLEEVERALVTTAKEQILLEKGFSLSLERTAVEKFRDRANNVKMGPLENFPRPIPEKVRKLLARAKALRVFDTYEVLFIDYTAPLKTTAEKIKEKDPIIFGTIKFNPGRLYFVADWVDEHCDLTLDKLVEQKVEVSTTVPLYQAEQIAEIEASLNRRLERLKGTNISTWRQQETAAKAEEVTRRPAPPPAPAAVAAVPPIAKKGFWARLLS